MSNKLYAFNSPEWKKVAALSKWAGGRRIMFGFLAGALLVTCLAGGAFYGYCYLSARAQKIPVTDFIVSVLLSLFRKQ